MTARKDEKDAIDTCIAMLSFNDNDLVREARTLLASLRARAEMAEEMAAMLDGIRLLPNEQRWLARYEALK